MKTKVLALALFLLTAATVVLVPAQRSLGTAGPPDPAFLPVANNPNERPKIEVVFALDTTGSMGGLIEAAKEKIWSIASTMAAAQPAPEIRMGLVAYRDRGDAYVTRVVDLSADLDTVYATLMDFEANGGGDGPESVNQALHDAVHRVSWSQDSSAYKAIFLVGDAPPHMDYQDDVKYPQTVAAALERGILINTIQCGSEGRPIPDWQQIAQLGRGRYFEVAQAGSAVAVATPFDAKLAALSAALDGTRLYYGDVEEKERLAGKVAATRKLHEGASDASRARRAAFNSMASGALNLIGDNELVDDVANGRVALAEIDRDELPETLQALAPEEREARVDELAKRRNELQSQIASLSDQRADYLRQKIEDSGGAKDSLDAQIYEAVRDQASAKGLTYESDAPAY